MVKRKAVEGIEAQKHQMIAALHSNSAYDKTKEGLKERQERIQELEQHFNKAIEIVYHPELHREAEIDWNNPFWAAAKRSREKTLARIHGKKTVQEVIDSEKQQAIQTREYDQI